MTPYFSSDYLDLTFDDTKQLGKAVWKGFLNSKEFRTACQACINLIREKQIVFWLADNRKMKAIRQQDQDWFASEIIPALAQSSLRKMATLVSQDIFNQMAVGNLESKANEVINFTNRHFKSQEEALDWLSQATLEKIQ